MWRITKDMFNSKLREYKERQAEINAEMTGYTDANETFYLTANMTLNLAKQAYEIFESSEVPEKRQLLNFLLQNLQLSGKKLVFTLKAPFDTVLQANKCSNWGQIRDAFRTVDWVKIKEELAGLSWAFAGLKAPI
jgi:hypothetical protein